MKILIGNDHGAIALKNRLIEFLKTRNIDFNNIGVDTEESVDYPDIAEKGCKEFLKGSYDFGILACGTGIGISIAANKVKGIRAALPQNCFAAEMAKEHNNANFIVFGGRIDYNEPVEKILEAFIDASFGGDRHQRRIDKIMSLENK